MPLPLSRSAATRSATTRAASAIWADWTALFFCFALLLLVFAATVRVGDPALPRIDNAGAVSGGASANPKTLLRGLSSPALLAAGLLAVALSAVSAMAGLRPQVEVERVPFANFPPEIAGWSGTRTALAAGTETSLGADDYVSANYFSPSERVPVEFFSAFYLRQVGRNGIHSPEVCLPNGGWQIASFTQPEIMLPGAPARKLTVNRAVIVRGEARSLVYYWFEGRGRRFADEGTAKLYTKYDGLVSGRTDGALVRFVTQILPDESEQDADKRLQGLLAPVLKDLSRYVPL